MNRIIDHKNAIVLAVVNVRDRKEVKYTIVWQDFTLGKLPTKENIYF